jgi:hypothetical protein
MKELLDIIGYGLVIIFSIIALTIIAIITSIIAIPFLLISVIINFFEKEIDKNESKIP